MRMRRSGSLSTQQRAPRDAFRHENSLSRGPTSGRVAHLEAALTYLQLHPQRFWSKVERVEGNGCWTWTSAQNGHGYGLFWIAGRTHLAHRISYLLNVGTLTEGHCACHGCDKPICVRPSHLFEGTVSDNLQDAVHKGRWNPTPGAKATSARWAQERAS